MVGVPFAASRVFDELASLAFDTAPGTRRRKCGQKSLDRADDVIDGAEFFNEVLIRNCGRLLKKRVRRGESYMGLRPTNMEESLPTYHSDPAGAGEESAFLHLQKQILRRSAPQNDRTG